MNVQMTNVVAALCIALQIVGRNILSMGVVLGNFGRRESSRVLDRNARSKKDMREFEEFQERRGFGNETFRDTREGHVAIRERTVVCGKRNFFSFGGKWRKIPGKGRKIRQPMGEWMSGRRFPI